METNKTNIWKVAGLTGVLVLETALQGCASTSEIPNMGYDPKFNYSTSGMKINSEEIKAEYKGNTLILTSTDPDSLIGGRKETMYLNNGKVDSFSVKDRGKEYFVITDTLEHTMIQPVADRRLYQVRIRKERK